MPHTIAENLARLQAAKTAIANAITAKGGTVGSGDGLEEFPTDISTISTGVDPEPINAVLEESNDDLETALGGGSSPVVAKGTVNFYDYDGTIVKSMSSAQFRSLESMPDNPTHEGLISQGWNWDLSAAKTYVAEYGSLNIGQMYITSDGKTRIYITLTEGRTSPILQLYLNANSELDIDWGDGGTRSTFTTTSAGYKSERHEYSSSGDYVIAITVVNGGFALQSSTTNVSSILWNGNNGNSPDRAYNNAIKKIEVGTGVTTIGQYAFRGCYSSQSITIPDGVTSIGQYAFQNCYSLSSITIPDSVTRIDSNAFRGCYSLQSITIPDGITSIGQYAFQYCYSLSSITIPDSVTTIGAYAFQNCSILSSVTIGNSVTTIGNYAFYGCSSLSSITIPDGVTTIGDAAFQYCSYMESIKFAPTTPPTVTSNSAWSNVSTSTKILVPAGTLETYTTATNYPNPSTYTYEEY